MELYTTPNKSKNPKREAPTKMVEMVADWVIAMDKVHAIPTLPNATILLTIAWIWYTAKEVQSIDGLKFRQSVADRIATLTKVNAKR